MLKAEFVPTSMQFADGFSKTLGIEDYMRHRNLAKLVSVVRSSNPNLLREIPADNFWDRSRKLKVGTRQQDI